MNQTLETTETYEIDWEAIENKIARDALIAFSNKEISPIIDIEVKAPKKAKKAKKTKKVKKVMEVDDGESTNIERFKLTPEQLADEDEDNLPY